MRGLTTILATTLALGLPLAACDNDASAPAPAPEPTPAAVPTEVPEEQTSIIRPEMEVERPPIPLEPLTTTIPFGDGGSDLSEAALTELRQLIGSDQWGQAERIVLRGHSDAGGSNAVNMRVARERAQAVADWMVERGIAEDRVEIIAFGAQNPVQPNLLPDGEPNERGRAANRRVAVTVLVPEGATIPDPGPTATPTPSGPPGTATPTPRPSGQATAGPATSGQPKARPSGSPAQ